MASKTDEKLAPFVEWLTLRVQEQLGISVSQDEMAMKRIKSAAAEALRNLDRDSETEINLPFLTAESSGPKHFSLSVRREDVRKLGP